MGRSEVRTKTLSLPRPNNIQPGLEGSTFDLMIRTGELAGAIVAFNEVVKQAGSRQPGLPGIAEQNALEQQKQRAARAMADALLGVAQTAVTMMFVLEEDYKVDLEEALADHVSRLIERGYIKLKPD
jgi:hypothetical protein